MTSNNIYFKNDYNSVNKNTLVELTQQEFLEELCSFDSERFLYDIDAHCSSHEVQTAPDLIMLFKLYDVAQVIHLDSTADLYVTTSKKF